MASTSAVAVPSSYGYVSASDNPRMNSNQKKIQINPKTGLVSYGGLISQYSDCDESLKMLCVKSGVLKFAVPKVVDLNEREWL